MSLDVTSMEVDCDSDGSIKVSVWCKCFTVEDIDDVIAWLQLARVMMFKWRIIRMAKERKHATAAEQKDRAPRDPRSHAKAADQ